MRFSTMAMGLMSAAGLAAYGPALAQIERSGGNPSQKIMQEYQQLAAERTSLQGKLAQMQKDLDAAQADAAAAKKERDALKGQVSGVAAAVEAAKAARANADQSLTQYKQRLEELVAHFRETAAALKQVETDRDKKAGELAARNAAFDQCAENNLQLYEITGEVLDRYAHVGLFTKVSASEPFTQITRTRIDNLVDDYRERARELRVKKAAPAAANAAPAAPAPQH
jgi:chromosome segregation ATPase